MSELPVTTYKLDNGEMKPYRTKFRDRVVYRVCNFLIRHVASKEYEALVGLSVSRGMPRVFAELTAEYEAIYTANLAKAQTSVPPPTGKGPST